MFDGRRSNVHDEVFDGLDEARISILPFASAKMKRGHFAIYVQSAPILRAKREFLAKRGGRSAIKHVLLF